MKFLKPVLFGFFAALLVTCSLYDSKKNILCNQPYALCTSAACTLDPKNPNKTLCKCQVLSGNSYGQTTCSKRAPNTLANGTKTLISTYSPHDLSTHRIMTCKSSSWSNCLDQLCKVDPNDPSIAICSCILEDAGPSVTYGGNCDTSTCSSSYWSGAKPDDNLRIMEFFKNATKESFQARFCPNTD